MKHILICKKNFSTQKNSNFCEKGVTKIELQNRQLFSSNFESCKRKFKFLLTKSGVYNYNVIMRAVITVDQCQKVSRYADTHPSQNSISITLQQVDTHSQKKCDRPFNDIVGTHVNKWLDFLTHTPLKMLYEKFQTQDN